MIILKCSLDENIQRMISDGREDNRIKKGIDNTFHFYDRYDYPAIDTTELEIGQVADWYQPVFECAVREFGDEIYAYYFELPFEETLRRHQTKPDCNDFGEAEMRGWWREKDYIGLIKENVIVKEETLEDIVQRIYKICSSI